jgi:hypothetical protein
MGRLRLACLQPAGIGALIVLGFGSEREEYYACLVAPTADVAGVPFLARSEDSRTAPVACKLVVVRKETVALCEGRCGYPLPPAWDLRLLMCQNNQAMMERDELWRERKTRAAAEDERKFRQDLLDATRAVARSLERVEQLLVAERRSMQRLARWRVRKIKRT